MPEEQATDIIVRRIYIKYNPYTLLVPGIGLCKLQHDRTGKITIS